MPHSTSSRALAGAPASPPQPVRLIVLAGQAHGTTDRLAERFEVSHRCLIPLAGKPLVAHVLQTAAEHPAITSLAVCIEREAFDPVWDMLTRLPGRGSVALVPAKDDLAESVRSAAEGWDGPLLVTTADHALLSPQSIDAVLAALDGAHVIFTLAPREAVEAIHPSHRHRLIRLREDEYVPCDLYGLSSSDHLDAADVFRGRRSTDRFASRVLRAAGLIGLLLLWLGLETLPGAIDRISRRLRLKVRAVVLEDGRQAFDVDDEVSHAIVRDLIESRTHADDTPASKARVAA